MSGEPVMLTWTIYDHPLDYPNAIVVRAFEIVSGAGQPRPRQQVALCSSVERARAFIQGQAPGVVCVGRSPEDDPLIIETWL